MQAVTHNRPFLGIACISLGMFFISLNDMLIKSLAGSYPLHQMVMMRALIAIVLAAAILPFEGGWRALRVADWPLHTLRCVLIVFANSAFYAAIVAMPLATANAIYFVAPLLVTLLSIPILGESVGPRRIAAATVGFLGVLIILWPEVSQATGLGWVAILPLMAAAGYATMSVLTRKLGARAPASVLSFWVQVAFIVTSGVMYAIAGDGRYLDDGTMAESLTFIFRAWVPVQPQDYLQIAALGVLSGLVGYVMSQAYRLAAASTVAPFEYLLMVYALFWGWAVFDEWPGSTVFVGAAVIIGSGLFIVWRERAKS